MLQNVLAALETQGEKCLECYQLCPSMTSVEARPRSHYVAAESITLNARRNAGITSIVRSPVPS